jgi:adenine-specific DNA-methyltransferase
MTNEPNKVDLQTPDLAADYRAALSKLFPGVLGDGVLDAAKLGELLDTPVAQVLDGRERYGLQWAGKQLAIQSLLTPSRATLVPDLDNSIAFDDAKNVFIEGDNLEVLKLLQKAYNDKIKLIYIDPPYNTGNDFVYDDDFRDGLRGYLEYTGQLDDEGNRTSASADTAGRRHSRWLSMMYPRLVLARNLLAQDGSIFVSIDDNESMNLRILLDEVFGPENFRADLAWQKRYTRSNNTQDFTTVVEHILVYSRSVDFTVNLLPRTDEADGRYTNPDQDPRGPWKGASFLNPATPKQRPNLCYPITNPKTGQVTEPTTNAWRRSKEEFKRLQSEGLLYWGAGGRSAVPSIKMFLSEARGLTPINFWEHGYAGNTDDGTRDLAALFDAKVFENPKPIQLMKRVLEHATASDSLVLDFFSGSGTLGEAVLRLNAEDGGKRTFILVQLPESTPETSVARASGFEKISDITRERIVRAMAAIEGANDVGLRSFTLSESNFLTPDQPEDGAMFDLSERTLRDESDDVYAIAEEVLLKEGVPLNSQWVEYKYGDVVVQVCAGVAVVIGEKLDDAIVQKVFELAPRIVVLMEDDLAGKDTLKANAFTNARNRGITMKTV